MYVSSYSTSIRYTGMVSGMDTDEVVKAMVAPEQAKLDRLYQQRQLNEWKRDQYRDITNDIRIFNDKYFNSLNPDKNLMSVGTYEKYKVSSTNSSVVRATTNSEAAAGTHRMKVDQLATAAELESETNITREVQGISNANFSNALGKSFVIDIDGTRKTITIDESITDMASLQEALDKEVGQGKIEISDSNGDGTGVLIFSPVENSGVQKITLSAGTKDALSDLGFAEGANLCNRLDTNDSLGALSSKMKSSFSFSAEGKVELEINGQKFSFYKSTSLDEMMNTINKSEAGVIMKYNQINDTFQFVSKDTGAGETIKISETGSSFLEAAKVTKYTEGKDALVILDGQNLLRSSNNFTMEGVTYSLTGKTGEEVTIDIEQDADAVYDTITSFINDYNILLSKLNSKAAEEYDRDFPPLTAEQKSEMSESEIEAWEEKAKAGLLHNDPILEKMSRDMRNMFIDPVDGAGISFASIGISTTSYKDYGKLSIDETKLKDVLQNDSEKVISLFCQQSDSYPNNYNARNLNTAQRHERYEEQGMAFRMFDVIQDNISTYNDVHGRKGTLIEKSGIPGSTTDNYSTISKELDDYDKSIETQTARLYNKQELYYQQYAAMEKAMADMQAQYTWLTDQQSDQE